MRGGQGTGRAIWTEQAAGAWERIRFLADQGRWGAVRLERAGRLAGELLGLELLDRAVRDWRPAPVLWPSRLGRALAWWLAHLDTATPWTTGTSRLLELLEGVEAGDPDRGALEGLVTALEVRHRAELLARNVPKGEPLAEWARRHQADQIARLGPLA